MFKGQIEIPHNLFEYAQDLQNALIGEPFVRRVMLAAEALRLLGSSTLNDYDEDTGLLIDARLAFWKPRQENKPNQTVFISSDNSFEGYAPNFTYFSIGNIELHPINSICLAVSRVRLLPGGDSLPENDEILIPVNAVENVLHFA